MSKFTIGKQKFDGTVDDFDKCFSYIQDVESHEMDNDGQLGMFEDFGPDFDIVKAYPSKNVWSMVDKEDGMCLTAGFLNSSIYYVLTEEEWSTGDECYLFDAYSDEAEKYV